MSKSIGFFDSGLGGISVLKTAMQILPNESFIYVADSKNAPYGDKEASFIVERAFLISEFLLNQGVKAIVVACNTATAYAIEELRGNFELPIIGVEPAIKPALLQSEHIAVMATIKTLESDKYKNLVKRQKGKVVPVPCSGLVQEIERGFVGNIALEKLLQSLIEPLLNKKINTIVLGCTHYSLIKNIISNIAGEGITVIDANLSVSNHIKTELTKNGLENDMVKINSRVKYYANDNFDAFKKMFNIDAVIHDFKQ